jgi:hypothetical protein
MCERRRADCVCKGTSRLFDQSESWWKAAYVVPFFSLERVIEKFLTASERTIAQQLTDCTIKNDK